MIGKKGLGRGHICIIWRHEAGSKRKNGLNNVSISDLARNPYQPRANFSEEKLENLLTLLKKTV